MSLLKLNYYDHPEGKDLYGKMIATNKYAVGFGLAYSTFDVLMYTKTKGYLPTLARYAYNVGPMMGMATAFTLTTYMATNVRGKDDRWNYFLGGLAAGAVYGSWNRSVISGFSVGLFLGMFGIVKKLSKQENWEFYPEGKYREFGSVTKHNYTVMAERPKDYTTNKE